MQKINSVINMIIHLQLELEFQTKYIQVLTMKFKNINDNC